jgi:pyrimidine operon attenuation protein/uracil phosphoribosyltransferase
MKKKLLLSGAGLELTLDRLCQQLLENHDTFKDTVIVGLQPRGVYLARRIHKRMEALIDGKPIQYGELDASFYRDDFGNRENIVEPKKMDMDFVVEDKNVILVDDVLYTGRTIRAGLDALLDFGRPRKVELLVLIDRRYSRHLPIQPDYVGKRVDTITSQTIKAEWKETEKKDGIWLIMND